MAMQANKPNDYKAFLRTHRIECIHPDGKDWNAHAVQHVGRCVEHLCSLFVRTIEFNTSKAIFADVQADGVAQEDEITRFVKMRADGIELKLKVRNNARTSPPVAPPPPCAHQPWSPIVLWQASLDESTDFGEALEKAKGRMLAKTSAVLIQCMRRAKKARERVAARKAERGEEEE
jgi:hypothetical protein